EIILRQPGSASEIARNSFCWIGSSYKPLESDVILDAVMASVSDTGEWSHRGGLTIKALLTACQNFIIFDKNLEVFRFAHLSVVEYLESKQPTSQTHLELAKVCLSMLSAQNVSERYRLPYHQEDWINPHLLLYSAI